MTDGWMMEPAYTISSPSSFGSGELKKKNTKKQYDILRGKFLPYKTIPNQSFHLEEDLDMQKNTIL